MGRIDEAAKVFDRMPELCGKRELQYHHAYLVTVLSKLQKVEMLVEKRCLSCKDCVYLSITHGSL
jgi:hypothetical protein